MLKETNKFKEKPNAAELKVIVVSGQDPIRLSLVYIGSPRTA